MLFEDQKLVVLSSNSSIIEVLSADTLIFQGYSYRCAMGRRGISIEKSEGDGCTPTGRFPLRAVLYRPDRMIKPETELIVHALEPTDAWCDDPLDKAYNQPVKLPFAASHEKLWRNSNIYDLIVVIGHNDNPVIPRRGSAIFMHIAKPAYSPTEGCIALQRRDLLRIVQNCGATTDIIIPASN